MLVRVIAYISVWHGQMKGTSLAEARCLLYTHSQFKVVGTFSRKI